MTFADLDSFEKVAAVERHLAQRPMPGAPRLSVPTLEAMRRVRLALVADDISDETFAEILGDWGDHLATLSAHDADAARYEQRRFVQIVEGLRGPIDNDDAAEQAAERSER